MSEPVRVREKVPDRLREKVPEPHQPSATLRLAIGGTLLAGRKLAELLAEWIDLAEEVQASEPAEGADPLRHLLIGVVSTAAEAMGTIVETVRPTIDRLLEPSGDGTLESLLEAMGVRWQELTQLEENRSVGAVCQSLAEATRRRRSGAGIPEAPSPELVD